MKATLDTNCFIDAFKLDTEAYGALRTILAAFDSGRIELLVSRHSLAELAQKPDEAYRLASTLKVLPHWLVGKIQDQVATIEQLCGTWEDALKNEEVQQELRHVAKGGNSIRDRGAYVDALLGGVDAFVTSDNQLAGSGTSERIRERFGLRVLKPSEFAREVSSRSDSSEISKIRQ